MDAESLLSLIGLAPAKEKKRDPQQADGEGHGRAAAGPATQLLRAKPGRGAGATPGTREDGARGRGASAPADTADRASGRPAPATGGAKPPPAQTVPASNSPYSYGRKKPLESPSTNAEARMPSLETIAREYPHVLDRLRAAWGDPRAFDREIDDLLIPARSGRKGFPPEVMLEFDLLRRYYAAYSVGVGRRVVPPWPGKDGP